jgi:hypothetical protein
MQRVEEKSVDPAGDWTPVIQSIDTILIYPSSYLMGLVFLYWVVSQHTHSLAGLYCSCILLNC